jgi:hypothetical protein
MNNNDPQAQKDLATALRQVMTQVVRLLEVQEPAKLLAPGGGLDVTLDRWREAVAKQTAGLSVQEARDLKLDRLEQMARAAQLQKEIVDLKARNAELLEEIVRLNKREAALKQQLTDQQFSASGHREDARRLDLEVRDLRRRIRELEGGPALTPQEAAPHSTPEKKVEVPPDEPSLSLAEAIARAKSKPVAPTDAKRAAEEAFKKLAVQPAEAPPAPEKEEPAKKRKKAAPKKKKKAPARKRPPASKRAAPKKKKKAPARKVKAAPKKSKKAAPKKKKKAPARKKATPVKRKQAPAKKKKAAPAKKKQTPAKKKRAAPARKKPAPAKKKAPARRRARAGKAR